MADCPYCKPLKPPGPYDEAARKRAADGVAAFDARLPRKIATPPTKDAG